MDLNRLRLIVATVVVASCGDAATPSPTSAPPTASPTPSPTPAPTVLELRGNVGNAIEIPGVGTLTVLSVTGWSARGMGASTGNRLVTVDLAIDAAAGHLELGATDFGYVVGDASPRLPMARGAAPPLGLPITLEAGSSARGLLTFAIPDGSAGSLRIRISSTVFVLIEIETVANPPPTKPPVTPKPTTNTGGGGTAATNYQRALTFADRASQLYAIDLPADVYPLYDADCEAGWTPEECQAVHEWADPYQDAAVGAIKSHAAWLDSHTAATCYRDGYAADRNVANQWLDALSGASYGGNDSPEGRAKIYEYNEAFGASDGFLDRLPSYIADCR